MTTYYTTDIIVGASDVYSITSTTDSVLITDLLPQAISLIETVTGVMFEAYGREVSITNGDAAWLTKAAAYQTAFMAENEVFSNKSVSSVSQDGLSVSAPDALTFVLSPLAKRAINNCSWVKGGTLKVSQPSKVNASGDFLVNDNHAWSPLGVS